MSFAEKLRKARKDAGLSQAQLARLSGITQAGISAIEKGIRSPTESTMKMLSMALKDYMGDDAVTDEKPAQEMSRQELLSEIDIKFSQLPQDLKREAMAYVAGRLASRRD